MKSIGIFSLAAIMLVALPVFAAALPPSATAIVAANGTLKGGRGAASAAHVATGIYTVTFSNADVPTACAFTASIGSPDPSVTARIGLINVGSDAAAGTIRVYTYDNHVTAADGPFQVYVAC